MILEYTRKSKIAAVVGLASILAVSLLMLFGYGNKQALSQLVLALLSLTFSAAFLLSCWFYIAAKGRSDLWILFLFLNVVGLVVIALLEDHSKEPLPPHAGVTTAVPLLPTIKALATNLLLISPAILFTGIGIGLPLLLSHLPTSESPNVLLWAIGTSLLVISAIIPPALVGRAAWLLGSHWLLYSFLSILFWPFGTFLCCCSLWDRMSFLHRGTASPEPIPLHTSFSCSKNNNLAPLSQET